MDDDERAVRALDDAWNAAYVEDDRSRLVDILADDFVATQWNGRTIGKAELIAGGSPATVRFAELVLRMYGPAAISRGRIHVEHAAGVVDQRFVRVYVKRDGRWQAAAVQVFPIAPEPAG